MLKSNPILSLETLKKITHDIKSQGKRIGITHGAFDIFHSSHLDLIKKSSVLCDFLIVGIDSDRNVSAYKTYKRPIFDELSRASIINELDCVGGTFIYDGEINPDAYAQLYSDLFIDVVTVGLHFSFQDVIEEQTIKGGAKLVIVKTQQYPSTTAIINKILERYSRQNSEEVPYSEV
jgi:cytidyltransferase-like protein